MQRFFSSKGEKYVSICTLAELNFVFCSSVYQLWSEDLKKSFSEYFQSVAGLHQFEKDTILGTFCARVLCF